MPKITSRDYRDYVIVDGMFVGEFDQMYRNVADPWHCSERAGTFRNDLFIAAAAAAPVASAGVALDVGCGLGALTSRLRAAQPTVQWHGCDVAPTAVAEASRRLPDVRFFAHDLCSRTPLPFPDGSLDLVTMAEVMWYVLPHLDFIFGDIRRALSPAGRFVMLQHFYPREEQKYGREIVAEPADLFRFIGRAGLRITDEAYIGGSQAPFGMLIRGGLAL